jgi:DNA-binding response OmpR family regulator
MDKLKVLLVDDMSTARNFIKFGLETHHPNLMISEASNGKEAKVKLEGGRFDLVLCDWEMPLVTGEDLLKWIRGHETLSNTKFIMITANSDKESVRRAVQMKVDGYLVKPFTMDKLLLKMTDVDSRFDRRKHERFDMSGSVTLHFREHMTRGEILDISMGGLLAVFSRKNPLPQILEKAAVAVINAEDREVARVHGFVLRLQAADAFPDTEKIKIAVKFIEADAQKLKDLQELIGKFAKVVDNPFKNLPS